MKIKNEKKSMTLNSFKAQELTNEESRKISGGLRINLFGIYYIDGVLDGIKGNTHGHWSWKQ